MYAEDGPLAEWPYEVREHNYTLTPVSPHSYLPSPRESIEAHGERQADPRIEHTLVLATDDYGNALRSAAVAYGRRTPDPDPRLAEADRKVQATTLVTYVEREFTVPVAGADTWRTPLPTRTATYQLHQPGTPTGRLYGFEELDGRIDSATDGAHDLPFEDYVGAGVTGTAPFRRLVADRRTRYRRNDLTGPTPATEAQSLALPETTCDLALTPSLISAVYGARMTASEIVAALAEGGYVQLAGADGWWVPESRTFYSPGATDNAATELAEAVAHFFQPRRYVDAFGNRALVRYDGSDLLVVETRDALDNVVAVTNDYRVLKPALVTDPNGNRRAAAFDALGMVTGTALMGMTGQTVGDSLTGFAANTTDSELTAFFADPMVNALALLGKATTRLVHDVRAFARYGTSPAVTATLSRVTHAADPGGATSEVECVMSYSDGFGQEIQQKRWAEGDRWLTSGWVVQNNKGKPVRQYEPFFDASPAFTFGAATGVSPILCYDPLERVVAVVQPHHAWQKTVVGAWGQETWDDNDTVGTPNPVTDPDVGGYLARLPSATYTPTWYAARSGGALGPAEKEAADKAAAHAGTSSLSVVDPAGRPFLAVAHNRVAGVDTFESTRTGLDVQGNERALVDAEARLVMVTDVDLLGRRIAARSMDAGDRVWLFDVAGEPIRRFDSRGHRFTWQYDALRRPIRRIVRGSDATRSDPRTLNKDLLYEKLEYGESRADGALHNQRTRLAAVFDGVGVDEVSEYDFKGNPLHRTRRFTADAETLPDWSGTPALEAETWDNVVTLDALNRPVTLTTPDGSVTRATYSARGLVTTLKTRHGTGPEVAYVESVQYDARGSQTRVQLNNGAVTTYAYDPATFRLTRLTTTRPAAPDTLVGHLFSSASPVQDLTHTYDPVGNVTQIFDAAVRTIFYAGVQVEPVSRYTYDATYRLVEGTGREQIGQSAVGGGGLRDYPFAGAAAAGDLQAVRPYAERYGYDRVAQPHLGGARCDQRRLDPRLRVRRGQPARGGRREEQPAHPDDNAARDRGVRIRRARSGRHDAAPAVAGLGFQGPASFLLPSDRGRRCQRGDDVLRLLRRGGTHAQDGEASGWQPRRRAVLPARRRTVPGVRA